MMSFGLSIMLTYYSSSGAAQRLHLSQPATEIAGIRVLWHQGPKMEGARELGRPSGT